MAERISRRATLARIGAGIVMLSVVPVAAGVAAAAFGLADADGHYVVDTGAGLVVGIRKSDGAMSWATYRGRALPNRATRAAFGSGFAGGALVTARRAGDHVVIRACSTDESGVTTYRYLVARKADPAVYLVVHADDGRLTDGPRALAVGQGAAPIPVDLGFLRGLGLLGLTTAQSRVL